MFSDAVCMGTILDSEMFTATAVIKVRECVQVAHTQDLGAPGSSRRFICNWSLKRTGSGIPETIESFIAVREHIHRLWMKQKDPPRIDSLTFGDLFCGAGGASCGFKEAGSTLQFGVEASYVAGAAFRVCI